METLKPHGNATFFGRVGAALLKGLIWVYRYTLSPLIGQQCRHLPTCSQYALDAINQNGAWRGFWLGISRVIRCNPWGTSGFDPAPDIHAERHPFWAPWRYGRWRESQVAADGGRKKCCGGDDCV